MILACVANHKFVALMFKIPSPAAKFFYLFDLQTENAGKKEHRNLLGNWMDYQGLEERGRDKPRVYIFKKR